MGRPKKTEVVAAVNPTEANLANLEVTPTEIKVIKAACKAVGMSIEDYVKTIKAALEATKTTVDKYGDEHTDIDHTTRLKAALMGLELEGYIKNKSIATDNSSHTHVTYAWLNAPGTVLPTRSV